MIWKSTGGRSFISDISDNLRYTIRPIGGRKDGYIIRHNGNEIGRQASVVASKQFAEQHWHGCAPNYVTPVKDRLEGKAYALRALKISMKRLDDFDDERGLDEPLEEVRIWLQCAIDVLEGRVPRLATLPEITS